MSLRASNETGLFLFGVIMGVVSLLAGASAPDAERILADGNQRYERGDFVGAASAFELFLAANPGSYEVIFKLATSYHELGDVEKFHAATRQLLSLDPDRSDAFTLMGKRYQWEGRFTDAESALRRALESDPKNLEARSRLADVCLAMGDREEGLEHLDRIVKENPEHVEFLWMLARSVEDPDRERELYRQILRASPEGDLVAKGRLNLLQAKSDLRFFEIEGLDKPQRVRLFYTPAKQEKKSPYTFTEEATGAVQGWAQRAATPNTPYIRVKVNGAGPFRFLLDTGTQGVHVSRVLANRLELESFGKSRFEGLGGANVLYGEIVFLESLQMGGVTVRNIPAEAIDLVGIGDGIVNPAVLRAIRVQLLNSSRSLRLSRWPAEGEPDPLRPTATTRLGPPETVPFLSFHGHSIIRVEIEGMSANALLDTGAENTILDLSVLERIPDLASFPVSGYGITLQGLTGELLDARVVLQVQMVVAHQNFRVKDLFAADLRRLANYYGPEVHAVLGMQQLRHFDMTFDYRRHQLTLQRILR